MSWGVLGSVIVVFPGPNHWLLHSIRSCGALGCSVVVVFSGSYHLFCLEFDLAVPRVFCGI